MVLNRCARRPAVVLALLAAATASTGCAPTRPASIPAWRGSVQTYIEKHGNGDINALRSVEVAPNRSGFRIFSHDRADLSKDIAGVLVGSHEHDGRRWYLYLVGEIEQDEAKAIHAAAVAQHGAQYQWREGARDQAAFDRYRLHQEQAWRAQHPGRESPPPRGALSFPVPGDVFEWQAMGDMVTIRERTSGAEWTVDLMPGADGENRDGAQR